MSSGAPTINNTALGPTPLVSIPNCSAHHLLGTEQLPLVSNALLSLLPVRSSGSTQTLVLELGESLAFPLDAQTLFGTQSGNGSVYLLRPHLHDVVGAQGWIRIELPSAVEDADSALGQLRDRFEDVLVEHGFLIATGARAAGDEITSSMQEGAADVKAALEERAESYKSSHAPTDTPASFSRNTHARLEKTSSVAGTAASYATSAANAIGGLSHGVGASLASALGVGQVAEADKGAARKGLEDAGYAVQDASTAVGDTLASVSSAAGHAVRGVLEHDKGKETADLAGHAGSAAGSVASVAGSGLMATSAAFHGTEAARGVEEVDLAAGEVPHPETVRTEDVIDLQK